MSGFLYTGNRDYDGLELVDRLTDLPDPVGGVITLADDDAYLITTTLDLAGNRIVCGRNSVIRGTSSENCRILSTGLGALPIITSAYSIVLRDITIEATGTQSCVDLDASGTPNQAVDWIGVNFNGTVGKIADYGNCIWSVCALLSADGLEFDGTIGTVAFSNSLFDPRAGNTCVTFPASLTLTRRLRTSDCAFIVLAGETGISVGDPATFPDDSFILRDVNFSGGGTYLSGIDYTNNEALITDCIGVVNSSTFGDYFMVGNATATAVSVAGTFYKVAGTTTPGLAVQKFDTTVSNRAEYTGAREGFCTVRSVVSMSGPNNRVIAVRIAVNGATVAGSEGRATLDGSGRSENASVQHVVQLKQGDYVEIWLANVSGTNNVTVTEMSTTIELTG